MKITFHTFSLGDVEDLDIYVAEPIYQWQQTKQGRWVMEHAHDLTYYTSTDPSSFGHRVTIRGTIAEGPQLTEYLLKYANYNQSL